MGKLKIVLSSFLSGCNICSFNDNNFWVFHVSKPLLLVGSYLI